MADQLWKLQTYFACFFSSFPKLCKGAKCSAVMCGIHFLSALKRCIHFKSSHRTDVQRQNHSYRGGCSDSSFLGKWLKEEIACSEMTYLTVTCCDHARLPCHTVPFPWKLDRHARHTSAISHYKGSELPICLTFFTQLTTPKFSLPQWSNSVSLETPKVSSSE